jgi:protein-S-isoprenylcysteine O-methyltransferase Ste14
MAPRPVALTIVAVYAVLAGLVLFARQSNWTLGLIYVGLFIAGFGIILSVSLFLWNTELAWRRTFDVPSGTKLWDWFWFAAFVPTLLAVFYVAVHDFDTRGHDLGAPGMAWLTGLAIYVAGQALFNWAGVTNPFFEKTVRIQTDQGHYVTDQGPYAIVRHPGYIGFIATFVATPLLLPSSRMCLLSLIGGLLFVIRTIFEDRTLRAELDGYTEYAAKVRFRLVPGVW